MINTDLKDRLLSIFPEGDTAGVDESVLDDNQHMELLPGIVSEFCAQTHLNARSIQWSKCFCNHWYFTSPSDPEHEEWFWKNISIKNEWVKQHNKPYRMIVVRVGRVAPYFDYHMNHFYGYGAENLLNEASLCQLCHETVASLC